MKAVAIVGYGYWGPKLARNFLQNGSFARVVICEEDPARLKRGLRENPGAEGVAGFDDDPASAPRLDPLRDPMLEIRSQFGRWNGR